VSASVAEQLADLPAAERAEVLASLDAETLTRMPYDWRVWARPEQLEPPGDWDFWVIMAGRGWGKSRTGAEWVRAQIESGRCSRMALVGPTAADVRDVMVEGESGLLSVCPPWNRPKYEPSKRRVTWPNGAMATCYSGDEPDRLNGPQHDGGWVDERSLFRYDASWDMFLFGLRLGSKPRACVTMTPRPTKAVRALITMPNVVVTRGSTYENRANLAPSFYGSIIRKYEGTRLGREQLMGEILDDVEGALWTRAMIDGARTAEAPDLLRIVIGVDPAVSAGEDSSETGIVVVGVGVDRQYYVLDDRTGRLTPDEWGKRVVNTYATYAADRVIGEVNNGGDLVEANLRHAARDLGISVAYTSVRASRGKAVRAEPVAALYEQGRVHHVGGFAALEDQLCGWVPGSGDASPDRMDALVWALTEIAAIDAGPVVGTDAASLFARPA
jgi:predicted phage terminase large subunit-like protein